MLVSSLRDSQRAVVEKQLRRNMAEMRTFSAETLLEDTECELVEGADAYAWWDDMRAKKQRTSQWLETVRKFADDEAERAGGVDFSIKVDGTVDLRPLTDMLSIAEESDSDSVESEEEADEEESEEEESGEEEDVAADARADAKELGIKRKRLET